MLIDIGTRKYQSNILGNPQLNQEIVGPCKVVQKAKFNTAKRKWYKPGKLKVLL